MFIQIYCKGQGCPSTVEMHVLYVPVGGQSSLSEESSDKEESATLVSNIGVYKAVDPPFDLLCNRFSLFYCLLAIHLVWWQSFLDQFLLLICLG